MRDRPETLVDLGRYPIDEPEGAGLALVEDCRRTLERESLCLLPGFLRPECLAAMVAEVSAVEEQAVWIESERTPWSWRDLSDYPANHPAHVTSRHRLGSLTRNLFDEGGTLLTLFKTDCLTEFVRRVLGLASLHRVECPYLSMNVKVMPAGSQHGWHFDLNDGAVSLLLRSAGAGGHYEYVPYIRAEANENYEEVAAIVRGERARVRLVDISPGTLCIFNGNRSLHRVSPVLAGNPDRLIAIFSYDRSPGLRYSASTLRTVLGALPA